MGSIPITRSNPSPAIQIKAGCALQDTLREVSSAPPSTMPASEQVIGRAFRRSVLFIVVLAAFAGSLYWLLKKEEPSKPPVDQTPVAAPKSGPTGGQAPTVRFSDQTQAAGIGFIHRNGAQGERLLPETMGSGVAFFDYDSDGDMDLLLVNSDHWPNGDYGDEPRPGNALYRNDGKGNFEDVSQGSGLETPAYGMGVAVADYDADGDQDVFLTNLGANRLMRNDSDGHFTDVTAQAGVAGPDTAWSTSATFFDYDGDGDLDLFVANYVQWSRETDFGVDFRLTGIGRAYGPPTAFGGSHSLLYRNDGDGYFTDVSAESGIQVDNPASGNPAGKALAVLAADLNKDGRPDLLVANDTVGNFWFRNTDQGFVEEGVLAGLAYDRNGVATGAMGADGADYRNDGDFGIAIGNFANEMTSLYVTQAGELPLADEAIVEGIGPASRQALSFGVLFLDYDLDGRLDFVQANGHLEEEIAKVQPSQSYRQPAQLFWNCGPDCAASFQAVADPGDLGEPIVGRAVSYADIDGDGDLDLLLTQNGGHPLLLRNEQQTGNHWLRVRLQSDGPNQDGIGAEIRLRANGIEQRRLVMPSRGYLSQVELPVTFGLGPATEIESLQVRWPDGTEQLASVSAVDRLVTITKGSSQ
ncbi:MAG: CRTAC1 family protein [Chromatiales bacterium]|nr:CRTAC1 family protein [Chromatiales bacterium]